MDEARFNGETVGSPITTFGDREFRMENLESWGELVFLVIFLFTNILQTTSRNCGSL